MTLPAAHAGHYLVWVLYAVPVLVVLFAIARTVLTERQRKKDD